jgi:hypothetical protein
MELVNYSINGIHQQLDTQTQAKMLCGLLSSAAL